jgi:hypothetical protein
MGANIESRHPIAVDRENHPEIGLDRCRCNRLPRLR